MLFFVVDGRGRGGGGSHPPPKSLPMMTGVENACALNTYSKRTKDTAIQSDLTTL